MKKTLVFIMVGIYIPAISFAQSVAEPKDFKGFVGLLTDIINLLVYVIFALTFMAFMWGIIKTWVISGGDTESVEKGKQIMFVSVVVFTIMSTVWGILYLLKGSIFGN